MKPKFTTKYNCPNCPAEIYMDDLGETLKIEDVAA